MQKLSLIAGLALVMLTASCSKDATSEINPSVKRVIGVEIDNSLSRTYIGEADSEGTYPVLWSEGDKVAVNGVAAAVDAKFVGTNSLQLEVDAAAEYKLGYPAELIDGDVLTISEVQKFVEGSFAVGSGVLVGYSQSEDVQMKNLYGYLKFSLSNAADVKGVTVVATGGEAISGTYTIDYKEATITPLAGKDIIRVTEVAAKDGVATVVVAVPAGEYSQGFTIKVYDNNNGVMVKSLKGAGSSVAAGVIYTMPQLAYAATATESCIMTAADLVDFVTLANGTNGYAKWVNADGEVKFGADIDLAGVSLPQIKNFAGKLNAQGFALKNWSSQLSFIGTLEAGAELKNLVIDQSCSYTPNLAEKNQHIAILVGSSTGLVEGCVNNADVTLNGDVTVDSKRFGLIVASGYGRIRDCINNGDFICNFPVVDQHIYIGGIVGYYNPTSGNGQGEEFIKNCINNGDVKVTIDDKPNRGCVGGVIGATSLSAQYEAVDGKNNPVAVSSEGTIARCYNNGEVSYNFKTLGTGTYTNVGGIIGYSQAIITDCENSGKVSFTVPVSDSESATRPATGGIVGSTLFSVNNCINRGEVYVEGTWSSAGTAGATATGGQNHPNFGGIAGSVGHYSLTTSETLSNCTNYGKLTLKPFLSSGAGTRQYFGGVAGYASVPVSECYNYGQVDIDATGLYAYFGGIIGLTKDGALITNCANYGKLTFKHDISACGRTDVFNGETAVKSFYGGVVGYAQDIVSNCHNYGVGECHTSSMESCCGATIGYATATSPISNCSNSAATTCYIGHIALVLSDYTGGEPYHYIGGVIGNGKANVDNVVNYESGDLTVYTNVGGDFGGVIGYAAGSNIKLENKAPMTLDFTYLGQTLANKGIMIGGVIAKNYANNPDNKITVDSCTNSGKLTVKNYAYTAGFSYFGGIIGSNDGDGIASIKNCTSTGDIYVDCPAAVRLGGVAAYTACDLINSSFKGAITAKRLKYVSATRYATIGGLIGYTAQGISGGSVDCVINAEGDNNIAIGGVMGTSGSDTWTGITVNADLTASAGTYIGLLLGGKVSTSAVTVTLGSANSPINIRKGSKINGVAIRADGNDPLSGMTDGLTMRVNKVEYIN